MVKRKSKIWELILHDLPKDKFRQATAQVRERAVPSSGTTFWQPSIARWEQECDAYYQNGVIDTPFVTVSVDENITVYDKTTHEASEDVIRFEDRGDIGKWVYLFPTKRKKNPSTQNSKAVKSWKIQLVLLRSTKHELTIPVSADENWMWK